MPTQASLERLQALVAKLTPLSHVQRGALIRAQDWNDLVASVLDVARAVLGEDRIAEVPPHDHADQVTAAWLDPKLRATVEKGPLADAGPLGRLGAVERAVNRTTSRIDEVEGRVVELRGRLGDVAIKHELREAELGGLHKAMSGIEDGRAAVAELRETMRGVQGEVAAALDLGRRLTMNGQPADLEVLNRRLGAVEELRTLMTAANGQVLDAATIERRLAGFERLATKDDVEAIASRPVTVPAAELAAIEDRLTRQMRDVLDRSGRELEERIGRSTAEALAGVDARISRAVSGALPGLTDTIVSLTRAQTAEAVRAGLDGTMVTVTDRLRASEAALRGEITAGIVGFQADVSARVRAELERELPSRLTAVDARTTELTGRVDAVSARVGGVETRVAGAEAQVLAVSRSEAAARAELSRSLIGEMDRRDATQADAFSRQVTAVRGELGQKVDAAVLDARRTILEETRAVATQVAVTEVKLASAALRTEFRTDVVERNIAREGILVGGGEGFDIGSTPFGGGRGGRP
ncbi:hypothetical protein [Sorangium sp. So ce542]|uniref:hypothetical protein n=1 Tax=Sorangium sp. So ce542 TaxID=3133316 RepID=UPI003F5E733A